MTTAPRAAVTLAVVDEGILQMKDYRTPDPYGYFYQKRALEVQAYDVYPFLLPELGGNSSTGGDGYDLGRRTTPVPSRRVQLVAKWSGILRADAQGKVRYRVRVPQFSGALRVMAVAYKGEAFGTAEHTMRVADPVVISTSLPRFLSPGDTIDVPVTLTNTTDKPIEVSARVTVSGPLEWLDAALEQRKKTVLRKFGDILIPDPRPTSFWSGGDLKPNSEKRVIYRINAQNSIGNGVVKIAIYKTGMNSSERDLFTETIELPIRPASPLQKRTGSGVVAGGQIQNLNLKTDFLPASLRSQLVVSRSPMTEFAKDLRYLLQYPYGCLEQIVSGAFPQLYYGDLAATLSQRKGQQAKAAGYNPNYHVQEAIRKVEAQQLYNGSLSYWPGGDYDNWWATAYAAHFLLEAQQAGFQVNKAVLDKTLAYLQFRLRKRETEPYNYLDAQNAIHLKTIAKKEITYSLYVLALAGRQDAVALNYYKANRQLLSQDSRVLLAATYALNGDQRSFQAVLPTRLGTETAARRYFDGSFSSPLRDQALTLNALLAADPNNPQIAPQARQLSRQMKQAGWLSTQERAFGLLALGKIARQNARSTATATLLDDGKKLGEFSGKDLTVNNVANRALTLRTSGTGSLFYFWEVEGISAGGQIQEEDAYLRVRRQYLNRAGQPIGNTFQQNDLVIVKITLQAPEAAGDIPNVAITDLLPAGLEIENPRIGAIRDITWATDAAQPDYLDLRDDRLNLFTTATAAPKSFYYVARAVSKGTFQLGPVSADAMYNAEYHSYNGSGVIKVK
ncbi:alpha-2-macroglobulin family protein [Hymenobacter radiodurans]|uniref:alpha-2-macroglobulin family protein n=1 Tax=Hymenobacter radiodurans TaxID=2496028 RepID=UPI00105857FB|nr:alpha-2-macroglobulin family protein [Hymenobacter radiodurans]